MQNNLGTTKDDRFYPKVHFDPGCEQGDVLVSHPGGLVTLNGESMYQIDFNTNPPHVEILNARCSVAE